VTTRVVWVSIVILVCATRFSHLRLLWIEEAYPAAAAAEVLRGHLLYRDIWFDKPPLYALVYTLWGAAAGWPLRIAGVAFVLLCCFIAYRFASELWGKLEASMASAFLALYLTFGVPSAVMALAPDLLMMPAHLAAVYFAWRGQAFLSGLLASLCLLFNAKGLFVVLVCLLWQARSMRPFLAGAAIPQAALVAGLLATGSLTAYYQQVWSWGMRYSADTFITNPLQEGVKRFVNWAGFHAPILIAALVYMRREGSRKMAAWAILSCFAVIAGLRFYPRYFFQLLPVACLAGARGFTIASRTWRTILVILLLVPAVRFAPRYAKLASDQLLGEQHLWSDIAMMQDSAMAAERLRSVASPGDTLLVWGYRPDVFVYSGLPAGTRFLDSQPLTGVIADRHLVSSHVTFPELAAENRKLLTRESPVFIVDGLGPLNPQLAITNFPDLAEWLTRYEPAGQTKMSKIYRLRLPDGRPLGQKR
jgi:hypothetical protein